MKFILIGVIGLLAVVFYFAWVIYEVAYAPTIDDSKEKDNSKK